MATAPAKMPDTETPAVSERRGECPTLARPMQTGDGLLARLRPIDNTLMLAQLRALAEAAQRFGNGIVEITARGSLQVRGLTPQTVAAFENAVLTAGIDIATGIGIGIETPPLAGLDPGERIDVRPLAEELRSRIAAYVPPLVLAPKLAIILDGGGTFHLGDVSADIRVTAFRDAGETRYRLAIAGTARTARLLAVLDGKHVVDAILGLLESLNAIGPAARGKDLSFPEIGRRDLDFRPSPLLGIHHDSILGLAFSYRQAGSASLIAFADAAGSLGARQIHLAPAHGFFVAGLTSRQAGELQKTAAGLGFLMEPGDPRRSIALCAGARGCRSAFYDTQDLAAKILAHAPASLDGSFDLHLSGCAKGCAHPGSALLTLVGARAGYGLVVNGAASSAPATYIAEKHIDIAIERLQALLRQSKEDGETALSCLTRLGADEIAAALQRDEA